MMTVLAVCLTFFLGVALGVLLRLNRWEVIEVENVSEVVNCRSCNKLRHTVQRHVDEALASNSAYWLPMVGVKGELLVDWQLMDVAKKVGRPRKASKK